MRISHLAQLAIALCACGGSNPPPGDGSDTEMPFEPDVPAVYVAKVKNLLVGLPPTDAEIAAVTANPDALAGLIDGWMSQPDYKPDYERKMMRFFELAFQQTQLTTASFIDISDFGLTLSRTQLKDLLLKNIQESFARTVLALNAQGAPFTEAITTKQYMMTTPLMEWYAYLDTVYLDDAARRVDRFPSMVSNKTVYIGSAQVSLDKSLDPTSSSYMRFTDTKVASMQLTDPSCDPLSYDPNAVGGSKAAGGLHHWFYGLLTDNNWRSPTGVTCKSSSTSPNTVFFTAADFDNWRMVSVQHANPGDAVTQFWNVPALRATNQLVLRTPRQGFFSTPAFQANWSTNTSNQMRVTANQTLIVALGEGFDGSDATIPPTTPGLDATHAAPGSACFGCHQLLDPMRSIFAANYSWGYGQQTDPAFVNQPGQFAFEGVIKPMTTIDDLATALATHPQFARAWVQKLCYYANSSPCDPDDPEFQRIVADFASNYQWNALVRELFASPLVTHATKTVTAAKNGVVVAVSRLDHLCVALDHRLGLADACVLDAIDKVPPPRTSAIELIAGGLPSDGYGRGSTVPVLPNEPTLFFRAAVENICVGMAEQVIDSTTPKWTSTNADAAIADFVGVMMGLTSSDPRAAPATTLLRSHFDDAVANRFTRSDALKSTFVVSCLAPSFVAIGM